jgi:hypothetical protein
VEATFRCSRHPPTKATLTVATKSRRLTPRYLRAKLPSGLATTWTMFTSLSGPVACPRRRSTEPGKYPPRRSRQDWQRCELSSRWPGDTNFLAKSESAGPVKPCAKLTKVERNVKTNYIGIRAICQSYLRPCLLSPISIHPRRTDKACIHGQARSSA